MRVISGAGIVPGMGEAVLAMIRACSAAGSEIAVSGWTGG